MNHGIYLNERFPGETLMILAIMEAVEQNREACTFDSQRHVCWLFREEIDQQQAGRVS